MLLELKNMNFRMPGPKSRNWRGCGRECHSTFWTDSLAWSISFWWNRNKKKAKPNSEKNKNKKTYKMHRHLVITSSQEHWGIVSCSHEAADSKERSYLIQSYISQVQKSMLKYAPILYLFCPWKYETHTQK